MTMTFKELQRQLDLSLTQALEVAKLTDSEIPERALVELSQKDFQKTHQSRLDNFVVKKVIEGSGTSPDRCYIATKGIPIGFPNEKGYAPQCKNLYLEVRALDFLCDFAESGGFHRMRDFVQEEGYNTSPSVKAKK